MQKELNILFAIDGSDFSNKALLKTAGLLKTNKEIKMTLFHGAADPKVVCSELIGQDFTFIEKYEEIWNIEAGKVLETAKAAVIKSGYNPDRLSAIFEKKCNNPAITMLKAADSKGIETIALGRWGKSTVSRQIIGSVTYRLAQLADNHAVWIIEPRISSYNVMIGLVGAPVSQRVVDYAIRYFGHLKESTFTLFHVIPELPPQSLDLSELLHIEEKEERQKLIGKKIDLHLEEYSEKVKEIASDAREKLIKAGIPEQRVFIKIQSQKAGIARDILEEIRESNHGILVIGRRGFKDIKEFGMGSKAQKLLIKARVFNLCIVN